MWRLTREKYDRHGHPVRMPLIKRLDCPVKPGNDGIIGGVAIGARGYQASWLTVA
jgi:hypothetical protein